MKDPVAAGSKVAVGVRDGAVRSTDVDTPLWVPDGGAGLMISARWFTSLVRTTISAVSRPIR